jgi:hypothetical protein
MQTDMYLFSWRRSIQEVGVAFSECELLGGNSCIICAMKNDCKCMQTNIMMSEDIEMDENKKRK